MKNVKNDLEKWANRTESMKTKQAVQDVSKARSNNYTKKLCKSSNAMRMCFFVPYTNTLYPYYNYMPEKSLLHTPILSLTGNGNIHSPAEVYGRPAWQVLQNPWIDE